MSRLPSIKRARALELLGKGNDAHQVSEWLAVNVSQVRTWMREEGILVVRDRGFAEVREALVRVAPPSKQTGWKSRPRNWGRAPWRR